MGIIEEKNRKSEFIKWIYEIYDTNYLSRYFLNELEGVLQGTYKNLKRAIPLNDLWELWKKSVTELRKIHDNKKRQGDEISLGSQPLYDLAIVVSKYEDFLRDKEKNRRIQAERESYLNNIQIDYKKLPRLHTKQQTDLTKIINGG